MTRTSVALGVAAVAVAAVITAACGGGNEQPATENAPGSSMPAAQSRLFRGRRDLRKRLERAGLREKEARK